MAQGTYAVPGLRLREGEELIFVARPHFVALIPWGIFIIPYLKWKNEYNILTTERVIERYGVISKQQRAVEFEKITDVQGGYSGLIARLFGIGYVKVETAGSSESLIMGYIPKPMEHADQVSHQMQQRKKDVEEEKMQKMAQMMRQSQAGGAETLEPESKKTVNCPSCNKSYKISKPGTYACKKCGTKFKVG